MVALYLFHSHKMNQNQEENNKGNHTISVWLFHEKIETQGCSY
jgi:hypothetical protein